jgi:hypothetical protein
MSPAEPARAAGPFEAVAEVVDFGRHVPPQSTVGDCLQFYKLLCIHSRPELHRVNTIDARLAAGPSRPHDAQPVELSSRHVPDRLGALEGVQTLAEGEIGELWVEARRVIAVG